LPFQTFAYGSKVHTIYPRFVIALSERIIEVQKEETYRSDAG